ncbi:MAG: DUF59 domain-containing protein [Candidatus Sumerlaeaceae bacterium]|jgi:FeS assembly SUF system protein
MTESQEAQPNSDHHTDDVLSAGASGAQAAWPSQAVAPSSSPAFGHIAPSASETLPQSDAPADGAASDTNQSVQALPATGETDHSQLREQIIQMLHTVYDPEIPVDIWELGLVYRLDVRENGDVYIQMTLTSPMCPVAGSLPPEVRQKVASVPGVRNVEVELTWDPPWHMGMMSDVARLKLGFM